MVQALNNSGIMNSQQPNSVLQRKEFQGRRASPLKICRDSRKIRKTAPAVPENPSMAPINIKKSEPVIVYMQSPKIIHTEVQDFMSLVQRLTGRTSFSDIRPHTIKTDNIKAGHDSTAQQASTASVDNMGMYYNVTESSDFANPSSQLTMMIDSSQDIESSASEPEAPEATKQGPSADTSVSSGVTTSMFSPLTPNFMFPSPRLNFSPSILQDDALMTPNSDHLFFSPWDFYGISEPLFSPPQRPYLDTLTMIRAPSPTELDLYKPNPEN